MIIKALSIKHLLKITLLAIGLSLGNVSAQSENPHKNPEFDNLLNSVVRLDVWKATYKDGFRRTIRSQGSGVIMSPEGHILTNHHVAGPDVAKIRVTLPNLEHVYANYIGSDNWTDIAVLQIDEKDRKDTKFSHANFGESEKLYLAEAAFAVGTPYGLTRSVVKGVISNNNRHLPLNYIEGGYELGGYNNWLQTDAAINPGNSGGPLVNRGGRVIGINNSGIIGADNLGFAIPSKIAKFVMDQLIRNGEVTRSYIGITPKPLQDLEIFYEVGDNGGLLIQSVDPGCPASESDLKPGDIILTINGTKLDGRFPEQIPPIMNLIANKPVNSKIDLTIKRGSEILTMDVTTEKLESRRGMKYSFVDWGLTVEKLSKPIAREQKLKKSDGFIVIGTRSGFPAQESGLIPGDIIAKADQKPIESLESFQNMYEIYQNKEKSVLLEVIRNRSTIYLVLKPNN